jgi:hypothetical protein
LGLGKPTSADMWGWQKATDLRIPLAWHYWVLGPFLMQNHLVIRNITTDSRSWLMESQKIGAHNLHLLRTGISTEVKCKASTCPNPQPTVGPKPEPVFSMPPFIIVTQSTKLNDSV